MTGRAFSVAAIVLVFVLAAIEAAAQPGLGAGMIEFLLR